MANKAEALTLWLGQELAVAQESATQEILFSDIAERVEQGATFDEAVADVTSHDPRAGDFGVEVVGSLVAVAVLDGLKVFWASYLKQLQEKAGKSLADLTIDFIKSRFKSDVASAEKATIQADLTNAIAASGTKLGVNTENLRLTLGSVRTVLSSRKI